MIMPGQYLSVKYDIAFKRVFGDPKNKKILIGFLNDILLHKGDDLIVDVEFLPLDNSIDLFFEKKSIVDVKCRDQKGNAYIVEMQVVPQKSFTSRLEFYASKMYCTQLKRGDDYGDLQRVVVIAIVDHVLFKDHDRYISWHKVLDTVNHENYFPNHSYVTIELPKFKKDNVEELDGMLEKWCYFLKNSEDARAALTIKDDLIHRAFDELQQGNWSRSELEIYEGQLQKEMDERAKFAATEERGMQKGLAQGLEKGLKQGRAEGRAEGLEKGKVEGKLEAKREFARRLLAAGGMSHAQIAAITELSEDEIATLTQ